MRSETRSFWLDMEMFCSNIQQQWLQHDKVCLYVCVTLCRRKISFSLLKSEDFQEEFSVLAHPLLTPPRTALFSSRVSSVNIR